VTHLYILPFLPRLIACRIVVEFREIGDAQVVKCYGGVEKATRQLIPIPIR